MESPVRGIRFIHHAINQEAADLEAQARAGTLDATRVAFFTKVLHLHAKGEEQSVFPALEERAKDVVPPYLLDHREEDELVAQLSGSDPARATALLREHLRLHIKKENEILVPLIERIFTPPEQGGLVGKMMAVFSPEDMAEVLPWMMSWLSPDDRKAYVGIMEKAMPPDRFQGVLGMLRGKLAPDVFATLGR